MALSLVKTAIVDPTRQQIDAGTVPLDATIYTVDITVGATSDYSSGIDLTSTSLLGQGLSDTPIGSVHLPITQVIGVLDANVRSSGGTLKPYTPRFNQNTKKLQFFRASSTVFTNAVQLVGTAGTQTAPLSANCFTLKGGTLATNGMAVKYRAWGTKTSAGEAGTIQVVFGGTIANPPVGGQTLINLVTTANAVAQHWFVQVDIIRTGATTQQIGAMGIAAADNTATLTNKVSDALFTAGSQTLANDLTILPTVNSTSGTTCTIEGQLVEVVGGTNGLEIQPTADLAASDVIRATLVCV